MVQELDFDRSFQLRIGNSSSPSSSPEYNVSDVRGGLKTRRRMEGNGMEIDRNVLQTFQKSFVQVQTILDQNRLLINEINQNHESKIPDNLSRNVGLIRELNNNIKRVVDVYAHLSSTFTKSMEASSEDDSNGGFKSDAKPGHKRNRLT